MIDDAGEESEEETIQQPTNASKGKGENAVELPFNRLARLNDEKEMSEIKWAVNDEIEISEEE